MIIPLTLAQPPDSSAPALPPALAQLGSSELFLLELQGELEVSGDRCGQLVGRLTVDDDGKGKPTLRVGHHLLEGKIVALPKPLAVLQRVRAPPSSSSMPPPTITPDGDVEMESADPTEVEGGPELATSYTIRTIVRKKIVFSKRPTPIVGLSARTAEDKIADAAAKRKK
ncbi:Ctf8-domain-containing protein [Gloeopeniophorella convolvens]|nr:Ctf8-domain-containing protein [Gloeopeniophorella convolvens]